MVLYRNLSRHDEMRRVRRGRADSETALTATFASAIAVIIARTRAYHTHDPPVAGDVDAERVRADAAPAVIVRIYPALPHTARNPAARRRDSPADSRNLRPAESVRRRRFTAGRLHHHSASAMLIRRGFGTNAEADDKRRPR